MNKDDLITTNAKEIFKAMDMAADKGYAQGYKNGKLLGFLLGGLFAAAVMFVALAVTS